MGGPARVAGRIGIHVVITVGLSFALAWLVQELPALAWALGALSLILLGWTVLRILRRPPSPAALGIMAAAVVAGWLASVATVGLLEDGALATENLATDAATPAPSTTTAADTDDASATTSTGPADPSSTTAVAGPGTVTAIEVADGGSATTITVATAGQPRELWLFSTATPGQPLVLDWADGWRSRSGPAVTVDDGDETVTVEIDAPAGTAWAVVDGSGTRVPASGHVDADGTIVETRTPGVTADRIAAQLVSAQRALPALDDDVAGLVLSLIGRQLTPGTFVLDRVIAGNDPSTAQQLAFVAQAPRFTQHLLPDRVFGVWALPDETVSCNADGCESGDVLLPVASAAAVAAAPGQLDLRPAEPGEFEGTSTTCVDVVAVPPGGPSIGRTCWLPDGRPTLIERTDIGDRLTLRSATGDVDPAHLEPPR